MKKKLGLWGMLSVLLMIWCFIMARESRIVQMELEEGEFFVSLGLDGRDITVKPWYDEDKGITYFFLPALAKEKKIYFDHMMDYDIKINGTTLRYGEELSWNQGEIYTVEVEGISCRVTFMKSENIPAFFIETESGSMDFIHENKENQERGNLVIANDNGHLQYNGILEEFSMRGNTTSKPYKKPYSFTLQDAKSLCGLEPGKKWSLLALYFEQDKIHTKIIFDMARKIGLSYTPESTWIDLYCNGEYKGLYLLTEAVTVADGRVEIGDLEAENENANPDINLDEVQMIQEDNRKGFDISSDEDSTGGYLLEKDYLFRVEEKQAYFTTNHTGYLFIVKRPQHASMEQVNYVADFVQNIEDLLLDKDSKYKEYMDIDSFASQFLMDKITLNKDGMTFSTFFYKKRNSDRLYAGPLWDYDRSMGWIPDYETPVGDIPNDMAGWYMTLYQDEDYYKTLVEKHQKLLPYVEKLLDVDIDKYAATIKASVMMDEVLMDRYGTRPPNGAITYKEYNSYIRYLKYFLANRINYLNSVWEIPYKELSAPLSTGEYHEVIFQDELGNVIETRLILDGECISDIPTLDANKYKGWYMDKASATEAFVDKIPIYEDTVLDAVCK